MQGAITPEKRRLVRSVIEGTERVLIGEVEGAMCLRLTGEKRKTQVTALVSQDDGGVRRITLETFQSRAGGWYQGYGQRIPSPSGQTSSRSCWLS